MICVLVNKGIILKRILFIVLLRNDSTFIWISEVTFVVIVSLLERYRNNTSFFLRIIIKLGRRISC